MGCPIFSGGIFGLSEEDFLRPSLFPFPFFASSCSNEHCLRRGCWNCFVLCAHLLSNPHLLLLTARDFMHHAQRVACDFLGTFFSRLGLSDIAPRHSSRGKTSSTASRKDVQASPRLTLCEMPSTSPPRSGQTSRGCRWTLSKSARCTARSRVLLILKLACI